jgi:hypothetical protein
VRSILVPSRYLAQTLRMKTGLLLCFGVCSALVNTGGLNAQKVNGGSQTTSVPTEHRSIINLGIPKSEGPVESAGGIIVADVNNDGQMDFLVTVPGHVVVFANNGTELWRKSIDIVVGGQSESQGLPGHHGPGLAVGDVDGDGRNDVVFLTRDKTFHVVDGATGKPKATASPPVPDGAERWELAMIATFRDGAENRDILFQATNKSGYRMGRYLAAYAIEQLLAGGPPLWTSDQFVSCAHNGARLADLNGNGKDEILGATIFSADGKLLVKAAPFKGHMDSVFVADIRPDLPGLEVVLLEEGSDHVQVLGLGGVVWREHFKSQEPQNAVIGRFKPDSEELFIWCRSRHNQDQKPFVFNSRGEIAADYEMTKAAPPDWTRSGVEAIHRIDWTGGFQQLACAKERHRSGDVCVFEPLSGRFVARFKAEADRLYVADVFGDWREEIIILQGDQLHIIQNLAPNPRPDAPRLWDDRNYRRMKQYHNYYSP